MLLGEKVLNCIPIIVWGDQRAQEDKEKNAMGRENVCRNTQRLRIK